MFLLYVSHPSVLLMSERLRLLLFLNRSLWKLLLRTISRRTPFGDGLHRLLHPFSRRFSTTLITAPFRPAGLLHGSRSRRSRRSRRHRSSHRCRRRHCCPPPACNPWPLVAPLAPAASVTLRSACAESWPLATISSAISWLAARVCRPRAPPSSSSLSSSLFPSTVQRETCGTCGTNNVKEGSNAPPPPPPPPIL